MCKFPRRADRYCSLIALQDKIRKVTRELMGRTSAKDKITVDMLPSVDDVEAYDLSHGPCCTIQAFKPDLSATPGTPWNKSIVQIFVKHFIATGQHAGAVSDRVHELFEGHLKYLCAKFKRSKRGQEVEKFRKKQANRNERQRNVSLLSSQHVQELTSPQLFHRRLIVAKMFPAFRRHVPILEALGPFGMSSDESSHANGYPAYRVFKKEWRNPTLTIWLRLFDSIYRRLRFNPVDQNTAGSHPHLRMYCEEICNRRAAVKHLPRNAYNEVWVRELNDYDRDLLEIQQITYDFSHPEDVVRCVLFVPYACIALNRRIYLLGSRRSSMALRTPWGCTSSTWIVIQIGVIFWRYSLCWILGSLCTTPHFPFSCTRVELYIIFSNDRNNHKSLLLNTRAHRTSLIRDR